MVCALWPTASLIYRCQLSPTQSLMGNSAIIAHHIGPGVWMPLQTWNNHSSRNCPHKFICLQSTSQEAELSHRNRAARWVSFGSATVGSVYAQNLRIRPVPHYGCMQPAYDRKMQPACRLHKSVCRLHTIMRAYAACIRSYDITIVCRGRTIVCKESTL